MCAGFINQGFCDTYDQTPLLIRILLISALTFNFPSQKNVPSPENNLVEHSTELEVSPSRRDPYLDELCPQSTSL